jgi:hypothetical protein
MKMVDIKIYTYRLETSGTHFESLMAPEKWEVEIKVGSLKFLGHTSVTVPVPRASDDSQALWLEKAATAARYRAMAAELEREL